MGKNLAIPDHQDLATWTDRRLDNAIKRGHSACGRFMEGYEHTATLTGVLLRERKTRLAHGEWLPWLEKHFNGTARTAQEYVRLANDKVPEMRSPSRISEATKDVQSPYEVTESGEVVGTETPFYPADKPEVEEVEEDEEKPTTTVQVECPHCHGTGWVPLTTEREEE